MRDLPEISVALVVLGAIMRVGERRSPGFADEVLTMLEDEAIQVEVVRLRGPKLEPAVMENFKFAAAWVNSVRRTTAAAAASRPKRKWFGLR